MKRRPEPPARKQADRRIKLLVATFTLVFAGIFARAVWLQIIRGPELAAMASKQHRDTIVIPAGRGTIYDRTGEPLAIGEQATTVYADPRTIVDPQRVAVKAASILGVDADALYPALRDRTKRFVYVKRKADPVQAAALEKLGLAGLGFYPEERRTYPQGAVGAHVVGYAGTDNNGLEGLERSLDRKLVGRAGYEVVVRDPNGRAIDVVSSRAERPGKNVVLTLDHQIQATAEQLLVRSARQWSAKGATAIVMDTRTGAILAMASAPTVDANQFRHGSGGRTEKSSGHRSLRARLDVQDRDDCRCARGQHRLAVDVVPARTDDPGRRPRDPRGPHPRDGDDDRAADPRRVVEHRDDHDRRGARKG